MLLGLVVGLVAFVEESELLVSNRCNLTVTELIGRSNGRIVGLRGFRLRATEPREFGFEQLGLVFEVMRTATSPLR